MGHIPQLHESAETAEMQILENYRRGCSKATGSVFIPNQSMSNGTHSVRSKNHKDHLQDPAWVEVMHKDLHEKFSQQHNLWSC